jgi:ribosomal protein S18 acetylase RimI-like enzyme
MQIRPFLQTDILDVKAFTDQAIGQNYFTQDELKNCFEMSLKDGVNCSFVVADASKQIKGLRLSYPPGNWSKGKGSKINPDLWGVDRNKVAYFQSLFVDESLRGQGLGPKLSLLSIEAFQKLGAVAIITHAWKESPNNSSTKYLEKFGFNPLAEHPDYWIDVNYVCTRDQNPCRCTAIEMIKKI